MYATKYAYCGYEERVKQFCEERFIDEYLYPQIVKGYYEELYEYHEDISLLEDMVENH